MSAFKTVAKFMADVPKAMQHEGVYKDWVAGAHKTKDDQVDLQRWEYGLVGLGEKNLLADLVMPNKFRLRGMDRAFTVESATWAKQQEKEPGVGSLSHKKQYTETFLMDNRVVLDPNKVVISDSRRPGVQIPNNEPLYKQMITYLAGVEPGQLSSVSLSYVGEKLVSRFDLRHLFLKGYLMLQSYNLAVSSGNVAFTNARVSARILEGVSPTQKIAFLMLGKIVVDASHFTREELWLLMEMASAYPLVKYGADNIYNNIKMAEDDLVIFVETGFQGGTKPGFGSPERLWNDLVQIAIKFNALEDLAEVVQDFRGLPGMMKVISESTGKRLFSLEYPKSYCVSLGISNINYTHTVVTEFGGYFATTKSLVADLLLTQMMKMSVYNVIEELGGLGTLGVPSGDAETDPLYNSHLRTMGIKNEGEDDSCILAEWMAVRSGKTCITTSGKLKTYVDRVTRELRAGRSDFLRPQLLFALPYSYCKNTTWGTIRGWRFHQFDMLDKRSTRLKTNSILKAYTWVMGVSTDLPKVGVNGIGAKYEEQLSNDEMSFIQLAGGDYAIKMVRHRIVGDLLPRIDEVESGCDLFYHANYPGTRCSIVFDAAGEGVLTVDRRPLDCFHVSSTLGIGTTNPRDVPPVSYGGGPFNRPIEDLVQDYPEPVDMEGSEEFDADGNPVVTNNAEGQDPELDSQGRRVAPTRRNTTGGEDSGGRNAENTAGQGSRRPGESAAGRSSGSGARSNSTPETTAGGGAEGGSGDGRGQGRPSVVHMVQQPELNFHRFPRPRRDENGYVVGVDVETTEGQTVNIQEIPNYVIPRGGTVRGYTIKTPADGTCGLHAVLENMRIYGFFNEDDKWRTFTSMEQNLMSVNDQNITELAAIACGLDMGLVVVNRRDKLIQKFGTLNSNHNVWVVHDGVGHWETFVPHARGTTTFVDFRSEPDRSSPQDVANNLRNPDNWDGDYPNIARLLDMAERLKGVRSARNGGQARDGARGPGHQGNATGRGGSNTGGRGGTAPRGGGSNTGFGSRGRGGGGPSPQRGGGTGGRGMTGQMPPHYSTNAEVNRQNARQEVESNRGSVNVLRQYGQRRDGHANTRWIGRNGSDRTRR
jgi:hypothetical protein